MALMKLMSSVPKTVLRALRTSSDSIFAIAPGSGYFYPHFNKDIGTADTDLRAPLSK